MRCKIVAEGLQNPVWPDEVFANSGCFAHGAQDVGVKFRVLATHKAVFHGRFLWCITLNRLRAQLSQFKLIRIDLINLDQELCPGTS